MRFEAFLEVAGCVLMPAQQWAGLQGGGGAGVCVSACLCARVKAGDGDGARLSWEVKVNCLVYVHVQLQTVAAAAASTGCVMRATFGAKFWGNTAEEGVYVTDSL